MEKNILTIVVATLFLGACVRVTDQKAEDAANPDLYSQLTNANAVYDSSFAAKLGADPYGMQQYVMAFLKSGSRRDQDSTTIAAIQKAHLENIMRLAAEGKLLLAGPFMDEGELRGIFIFNVKSMEEAQALADSDPAVKAGRLSLELHPWYGSAVLPLINPLHKRLEKTSIVE